MLMRVILIEERTMFCPECGEVTGPGPLDSRRLSVARSSLLHRLAHHLRSGMRYVGQRLTSR
jgi:hypothetical protein